MKLLNTKDRYGWVSMGLHWLMLLLLVSVYACILLGDIFPKGSDARAALRTWHFMLGLTVFALVWVRLAAKLISPAPVVVPPIARWQELAAKLIQAALYGLMFAMPIAGWLILSASGKPVPFYGLQLPALIGENKNLAEVIKGIHETGAAVGYFLIGFHAAAALYHHYFVRDNVLDRMLPERG